MTRRSKLWAVVPVKRLAEAKQRLMSLLTSAERTALSIAMLEDVLATLVHAQALAGVLVITGDAVAAGIARSAGAEVIDDQEQAGTSAAVRRAAREVADKGASLLVVPADVPSIKTDDVARIAEAHDRARPAVTLVPAIVDGGTNAMASTPPGAIPFCFGKDSFRRHMRAAREAGIEPLVLQIESLGRDIDRPLDLATFARNPSPTRTHAWLAETGIVQRLNGNPANGLRGDAMRVLADER